MYFHLVKCLVSIVPADALIRYRSICTDVDAQVRNQYMSILSEVGN